MPIRRAAATPPQEKIPSAAAEKDEERADEDSATEGPVKSSAPDTLAKEGQSTDESEPTENGEKDPEEAAAEDGKDKRIDKCKDCLAGHCTTHCYVLLLRLKDGYKYEKSKGKKVKRTIPAWASIASNKKVPVTNYAGTQHKLDNILVEAITSFNSRSGVSYQSLFKYIVQKYPSMDLDKKKFLIKKAMKKQLGNGSIKQLKGKGLSGTFAIGKVAPASKVYIICNLPTAFVSLHDSNFFNCPCPFQKTPQNAESLGDALPLIITRLCQPKEASYTLIKKYLMQHFPALNVEKRPDILKAALVRAIEKGQVEQITGKGASGTFQLKRPGNKIQLKGSTLDDAIVAAITAMNEPKTCSTTTLRKHLVDANKDRKEHILVSSLRRTLTKCKVLGWMEQITGHGFTGTYRLSFPYYPSPTVLYPDRFKELEKTPVPKRRKARSDDESEESEESEEEESEDEAPVHSRSKRPPPKARRPPPSKSRSTSRSKSKASKKLPVKKVTPSKKMASKPVSKKVSVPVKKATPVKKGAPAKKPKTPAVKKMASRAAKRPAPRDLSSDEEEEDEEDEEEVKAPKKTAKGRSNRSKPEESPAPPAKKQATKSVSRAALKQSKPAAKKGAKSSAQSARKSKRGKR
ncbi:heterochromatin protein 1-binding protein 3 isoform X1 [Periophthalmus magnuspinnatus]|uniref:heterochromatin protein 1-binding protein 3 isoform X1 n=1 Tax=Periophthalmus magnuspinnatus TaxID=409849 RepID=UPI00145A91BA|nr:heterochromatin protein 1-binding protein 3 isoform X1 [Periophthalmus magnuspinnatus]